jgi:hypothetical protein
MEADITPRGFNPPGNPIDPAIWKPSKDLSALAMRRCDWISCDAMLNIADTKEWLAAVIVGCYYQGLADGVKHMARKQRKAEGRDS